MAYELPLPVLGEQAQTLYRWTLVNGPLAEAAVARAADESQLSEAECRSAIETLVAARLLQPLGTPAAADRAWQAQSPQTAGAQLLSERETRLQHQEAEQRREREQLQSLREAFAALMPLYLDGRRLAHPHGAVDLLTDKFAVRAILTEAVGASRRELLISKPGGSFPPGAMREALPRDLELLASGVRMRNLYQHVTRFDQATRANAEQLIAAGAEIRTLTDVLPQMIVIDAELAFLPAGPDGALLVREPSLLAFLTRTFERDWENATPFTLGPQAAHDISEDLKQNILLLLSNGLKDEAIARRLGISLRTCRRHISELLEALGADSRFQAGVITERLRAAAPHAADEEPIQPADDPTPQACCTHCGDPMPPASPTGRRRLHCSARCRLRAHRARQQSHTGAPSETNPAAPETEGGGHSDQQKLAYPSKS
ncbi:helix-turn-helix domain-containing protein [Kitasatospora sp. McL0602]|uniref:helix-turn-helix transcriptional regulator n=1 Tax=Kitasatospora sp. McL0602 TaxID=3439530 RepID=UPI003F8A0595